jgi:NTE family protein
MAIPGIFDEHSIDDAHYVDGFLCENLGVNEASFEHILAVDVLGTNAYDTNLPDNFFKTANVLEMFEKSMRLLILNQTRTHLENLDKEVMLIEPNTKDFNTFHFHKYAEIRSVGLGLLA